MIYGIGTDIVAVARLHGMWARHGDRVLDRILAPVEIAEFARAANKGRFLAKRFAAKEAFSKAYGTGLRAPVLMPAIAISHDSLGKPGFALSGDLNLAFLEKRLSAHLSISDEADYVLAFVILEHA